MDFLESDLFDPVSKYFIEQGYEVRGEVKGCDIVVFSATEMIIVELKKAFNLKLVYQAMERQSLTPKVYVAIGRSQKGMREKNFKNMIKLLKSLDIGLITVAMDSPVQTVEVLLEPTGDGKIRNSRKTTRLKNEVKGRSENLNKGGVTKTKIITAYREKSIELLCLGEQNRTITNKMLKELGYDAKMAALLYKNYYGWFTKVGKAQYIVSEKGVEALNYKKHEKLVEVYRKIAEGKTVGLCPTILQDP